MNINILVSIFIKLNYCTREDNEIIKTTGESPENWTQAQCSHKDIEARWTCKRGENFFGFKLHACVDVGSKLIRNFCVTPANEHDSQHFEELLDVRCRSRKVYADAG